MLPKKSDILWNDSIKLAQPLWHNRIKYAQKLKFYLLLEQFGE